MYLPDPNTVKISDVKSIKACEWAIYLLFERIAEVHGEDEARRMFAKLGRPLTATEVAHRKRFQLALEWHKMPKPRNKSKLARELVERNRALPPGRRYGSRDTPNTEKAMRKAIDRAIGKYQVLVDDDGQPWGIGF